MDQHMAINVLPSRCISSLSITYAALRIGAKLGWFVVETRPTQADISRKIVSSWPQSTP